MFYFFGFFGFFFSNFVMCLMVTWHGAWQAVMRHLEVWWHLFDEALSRFGDLEAMIAISAGELLLGYLQSLELTVMRLDLMQLCFFPD